MKKKILRLNGLIPAVVAIIVIISLTACSSATVTTTTTATSTYSAPNTTLTNVSSITVTTTVTSAEQSSDPVDFVSAAAKILPSVVTIEDQQSAQGFFGQPETMDVSGSGWILDTNGDIVTNAHVVYNATDIKVTLADGSVYPAAIVQTNLSDDLAVIKITASGLQPASIGDSSKLAIGQLVAAVGNSLDEGVRLTGGYVSRLNVSANYTVGDTNVAFNNLIETDTVINPGNSGGVLIDTFGNVVGITNAALVGSTEVSGFGYVIPINSAMPVIDSLISQGAATTVQQ